MRVTFLGTGTSAGVPVPTCGCEVCRSQDARDRRLRPSVLLEWDGASVLVDASTDLRQQALTHGIRRVDAVLFTHHHADHVLGLDDLRVYNWRQRAPIPVYGSAITLQKLSRTFWYVFSSRPTESTRPAVEPIEVEGGFVVCRRLVEPIPVLHGEMPIVGYRVGAFAYLTDVSHVPEESHAMLRGLDVLVLSALRRRRHPTHLSLDQAQEVAARIGAGRTYFTHMSHEVMHEPVSRALPEGIALAYDGLALEVDEGREVTE